MKNMYLFIILFLIHLFTPNIKAIESMVRPVPIVPKATGLSTADSAYYSIISFLPNDFLLDQLSLILSQGIGDTIRVSLTGDPVEEIYSAKTILRTLGLYKGGIEVVSCPTCGRTNIDLEDLVSRVEKLVLSYDLDIKLAVMGCVVNGPGEAREADLGVCGGRGEALLIRGSDVIKKVPESQVFEELKYILDNWEELYGSKVS